MNENRGNSLRYLHSLFYIQLAGGVLTALIFFATLIPFAVGAWFNVAQTVVNLGVAVCLILLPGRYRLSGIARAVVAALGWWPFVLHKLLPFLDGPVNLPVINAWTFTLGRVSLLLGLAATALEYTAHASAAPKERNKWYVLLACSLTVSLLSTVALSLLQPMLNELSVGFIRIWNIMSRSVSLAAEIIYLVLLQRTIRGAESKENTAAEC